MGFIRVLITDALTTLPLVKAMNLLDMVLEVNICSWMCNFLDDFMFILTFVRSVAQSRSISLFL